jgi:hypothetical protein
MHGHANDHSFGDGNPDAYADRYGHCYGDRDNDANGKRVARSSGAGRPADDIRSNDRIRLRPRPSYLPAVPEHRRA